MEDNKNPISEEEITETSEETAETVENEDTASEEKEDAKQIKQKKLKKLEAECAELAKKLEAAEADLSEANDKYTRLFAEYDNYRKRTAKERAGIYTDASAEVLTEVLPILDNMERALKFKDAQGGEENMAKGIEMIMKSFSDVFEKLGVMEIESLGKTFDPNLHNAVMHIDDDSFGEGEIVEVFMKGYIKGDKVLRHSMVKVAN